MDGDSNQALKAWCQRESLGVDNDVRGDGLMISLGPWDLEGIYVSHNDALVI